MRNTNTGPRTINTELFNKVADAIDNEPHRYNQESWQTICGTAHCVGGWAVIIATGEADLSAAVDSYTKSNDMGLFGVGFAAAHALGLDWFDAGELFDSYWEPHDGLSVGDALRKIGGGDPIKSVTRPR